MTCLGKQVRDEPTLRRLYLQDTCLIELPMPLPMELKAVTAAAEPSVAVRPPLARGSLNTSGATLGQRSVYPFKIGLTLLLTGLKCRSPTAPSKRRHKKSKDRCSQDQANEEDFLLGDFFELCLGSRCQGLAFICCCRCFARELLLRLILLFISSFLFNVGLDDRSGCFGCQPR